MGGWVGKRKKGDLGKHPLADGNQGKMVWHESEVAFQHFGGKIFHERARLDMQVAEHLIRTPPAEKADDVGVDARAKKRHRAGGAERSSRDIGGEES